MLLSSVLYPYLKIICTITEFAHAELTMIVVIKWTAWLIGSLNQGCAVQIFFLLPEQPPVITHRQQLLVFRAMTQHRQTLQKSGFAGRHTDRQNRSVSASINYITGRDKMVAFL